MSQNRTFSEILEILYSITERPLPSVLSGTEAYTTEVESILRMDGWTAELAHRDHDQRCIQFTTPNKALHLNILNQPNSTIWQITVVFFAPWPDAWVDAHKIGFLNAYELIVSPFQTDRFPAMPICILHLFSEGCLVWRFLFNKMNAQLACARPLYEIIDHLGLDFFEAMESGSEFEYLHKVMLLVFYNEFGPTRPEKAQPN